MNKKELENEIMKTQEQLKKLQAALDEAEEDEVPNMLSFEKGEKCYYTGTTGAILENESLSIKDQTYDVLRGFVPAKRLESQLKLYFQTEVA